MSDRNRKAVRRASFQVVHFRAALGVLLRRPAALLIGVSLLALSALLVEAITDGRRTSSQDENTPTHEPSGAQIVFVEEWQEAMQTDQPDLSVHRLRLDFLSTQQVDGEGRLQLADINRGPNGEVDIAAIQSTRSLSDIIRKFPNTQWVSLREEQLSALPIRELNALADLTSIEFTTNNLQPEHLDKLNRATQIQNLTLEAIWCKADLGDLAGLTNLKSLHLKARDPYRGQISKEENSQRLVELDHVVQLASVPRLEELVLEDRGEFLEFAWVTGLNADNEALYEKLVESLKSFPSLNTLYVGRMSKPHGDTLLVKLGDDLPALSVHPASFDSSMAFSMGMISLVMCLGLFIATSHLMTCNSLGQNCLLTGAREAHLGVYLFVTILLLSLSALIVVLNTFAEWLPVLTFELSVWSLFTVLVMAPCATTAASSGDQHPAHAFISLLFFPVAGFVVFAWMGNQFWGVQVAKLFCGHFSILCTIVAASAVILIVNSTQSLLNVHRLWAESGLPPAASWREFQESCSVNQQRLLQGGLDAKLKLSGQPIKDRWLNQLQVVVAGLKRNPASWVLQCRLWLAAIVPFGMAKAVTRFAVIWPIIILWPLAVNFIAEGKFDAEDVSRFSMLLMTGFLLVGIVVVIGWYRRQSMYSTEILRPIRRSDWRKTVVTSMLATVALFSLIVWGQIQFAHWVAAHDLLSAWNGLSLLSLLSAILFATGAFLLGLICRRILFAALLILIGLLAYVPLGVINAIQTGELAAIDFPSFPTFLIIIGGEFVIGAIMLKIGWKQWARIELDAL